MSYAIEIVGLRFAYPALEGPSRPPSASHAPVWVIDGLDLCVAPGEWLAVMGPSDAGKTTLCLLLTGLAPHLSGGTLQGQIVVAGRDTRHHPPPALVDAVGLVFQEPEAQLLNATVEAEVAWGLENLGLPTDEIASQMDAVLSLLNLSHLRSRSPGSLSGGEKKRLALASVLAMRPAVLVLDEPMGGLDPAGREEVLNALAKLRRESNVAIVMTESDPEAVAAFADRLAVLHRPPAPSGSGVRGATIVLEGTPRALFHQADELAALGVGVPQMARVASTLNQRLASEYDFLSVQEASATLAVPLG